MLPLCGTVRMVKNDYHVYCGNRTIGFLGNKKMVLLCHCSEEPLALLLLIFVCITHELTHHCFINTLLYLVIYVVYFKEK